MDGGRLKADDRPAGVFDELAEDLLAIILLTVRKAGEGTHADDVAEAPDHGDGLAQVLGLVPVHHHSHLRLELPAVAVDVQHDGVHAEVQRRLLAAQARTQGIVEENQDDGLVGAQMLPGEGVFLDLEGFLEGSAEVSYVLNVEE